MCTKEQALKEWLKDKIFATGEEGWLAGWEAGYAEAERNNFYQAPSLPATSTQKTRGLDAIMAERERQVIEESTRLSGVDYFNRIKFGV